MTSDPRTDVVAAADPATARHERAKTRMFLVVLGTGIAALVGAAVLYRLDGLWMLLVVVLVLPGIVLVLAGSLGLVLRVQARKTLAAHPWRELDVRLDSAPASPKPGKCVLSPVGENTVRIAVANVPRPVAVVLKETGRLWYAGDLSRSGNAFVRVSGRPEVFFAMITRR